jgi:hypothetical protein
MTRTRVPHDAKIYIELGATRPTEMAFDSFGPFKILWVVTNGCVQRNFLWVTIRSTGIYVAFGGPVGVHTSYHSDGTFHWKTDDGYTIDLQPKPPLPDILEPILIQSATSIIRDDVLDQFELTNFTDQPVDRVIYLDNRMLPEAIYYHVWVVPPFRHGDVPLMTEHPAHLHLITHTNPWIEVIIYEQGRRRDPAQTPRE